MANEYMRDALAGTKAYLEASLEAQLAAVETARSLASGSIPRWKFLDTEVNRGKQYPALEILPRTTARAYGESESPYSEEHWNLHGVGVFVTATGTDHGEVLATLQYYAEALERCVGADLTFGSRFNRVRLGDDDYLAALSAQRDGLIKQTAEIPLSVRVLNG